MATALADVRSRLRARSPINVLPWLPFVLLLSTLALGCYLVWRAAGSSGWAACTLAALASSTVGGLIGFLFGVPPSTSQVDGSHREPRTDESTAQGAAAHPRGKNTALEEISSWLTRIIIGAGLVNLSSFTTWLGSVGGLVGTMAGLQPGRIAVAFGTALILYFSIVGFVAAYTYTRTTFSAVLADFDHVLLRDLSKKVEIIREETRTERSDLGRRVQELMESQMLTALYASPPGSYVRAIELADQIGDAMSNRAQYYLACAYGQQLKHEPQLRGTSQDVRIRDRAYEALKQATRDPDIRALVGRMLRGLVQDDDDLNPFATEERFLRLVDDSVAGRRDE